MELEKIVSDNVRSGLKTTLLYERQPFAVRVSWIDWDSGFRDSGLQIEDLIIGVDGVPLELPADKMARQNYTPRIIGNHAEYLGFADRNLTDGAQIVLTVLRKNRPGVGYHTLELTGTLRAERAYYDARERRSLGPGGPDSMARDTFDESWGGWYGKCVWDWERWLDGRWLNAFDNRQDLKRHLERQVRVEAAEQMYPGPFSQRLREDFDAVTRCLEGAPAMLPPDALTFREESERRQKDIADIGEAAWTDGLAQRRAEIADTLPRVDLVRGDRSMLVGTLIVLQRLSLRRAVTEGNRSYLVDQHSGFHCFIATDQPAIHRLSQAIADYQIRVAPRPRDEIDIVGRIKPDTRMVVYQGRAYVGLDIELLAAKVNGHFYIDLTTPDASFAGRDRLQGADVSLPPDDAEPADVIRTAVAAVKAGNEAVWRELYATWTATAGDGLPYYRPFAPYDTWESDWRRARNVMLNKVCDARPVWTSEPRPIVDHTHFSSAPHIEQVFVEVDHVGRFDDGDRVFSSVDVRRVWTLQRRDGGPWRIASRLCI